MMSGSKLEGIPFYHDYKSNVFPYHMPVVLYYDDVHTSVQHIDIDEYHCIGGMGLS